MGFHYFKATEPLRDGLFFTTWSPGVPGTHLMELGQMKVTWSHSAVLNSGPLEWESSTLIIRSLFHKHYTLYKKPTCNK